MADSCILAAAGRIPPYELSAETVAAAYGRPAGRGARRFAAHDEDALTLAYGAAERCLRGRGEKVESIFVASTTWPRAASSSAERLAAWLDLAPSVEVATFGGSWRCGAAALRVGLASGRRALVVASERLNAPAGSDDEIALGDGAAAILVGPGSGAKMSAWLQRAEVTEWDSSDARLLALQASSLAALAKRDGVARAALSAPGSRAAKEAAGALGLPCLTGAMDRIGFCGAAQPLLALIEAMESSKPGERFLWAAIGEGVDAATVEAAPVGALGLGVARPVREYGRWLAARSFFAEGALDPAFSSPAMERRDADFVQRLHGTRCQCGATRVLPAPACGRCGAAGGERVALSRTGTVFTFTHEHYVPTPTPPVTMAVVDLDGGGRILVQAADLETIAIGARVRLVPRVLHRGGGRPNYYWKAVAE